MGINRGTVVKAGLPLAKNEACAPLHLLEWQQRKSAKTEGLNKIQSQSTEPEICRLPSKITHHTKKQEDHQLEKTINRCQQHKVDRNA